MQALDFKSDITTEQLLNYIMDLGGSFLNDNPHIVITRSTLMEAGKFTRDTIKSCIYMGLIREVPFAKTVSEYNITPKGPAFLQSIRQGQCPVRGNQG